MVRAVTRDEFVARSRVGARARRDAAAHDHAVPADVAYEGYKWGMAIDVNACIGCNACVVGCQSRTTSRSSARTRCCAGARCTGCASTPTTAGRSPIPRRISSRCRACSARTRPARSSARSARPSHSHEGLNDMVYNRCVGTRYCSDNCPYKVRRFNFLLYQDWNTPSLKLGRNPDVTVRSRGVMEKCTYCVQRIKPGEDRVREGRPPGPRRRDQDRVRAGLSRRRDCLRQPERSGEPRRAAAGRGRNYSLLGELNTRPRTTYLAAVRNVNPELGDVTWPNTSAAVGR